MTYVLAGRQRRGLGPEDAEDMRETGELVVTPAVPIGELLGFLDEHQVELPDCCFYPCPTDAGLGVRIEVPDA